MSERLHGQVAVVTGAGRGIGRAVAELLVAEGATVVGVSRTATELDAVAEAVAASPGRFIAQAGSLTDRDFVEALFGGVAAVHGRLDILVNNAGIAPGGSIFELDPDRFRAALDLNIWAVFLCTQQAVRLMQPAGRGKIVTIGSVRSHWTEHGDAGAYNASKYGVRGFVESVARELQGTGLNIAMSLVCPGVVDTSLTNPRGESRPTWLRPEVVAETVLHVVTAPDQVNVFDTIVMPTAQRPW